MFKNGIKVVIACFKMYGVLKEVDEKDLRELRKAERERIDGFVVY